MESRCGPADGRDVSPCVGRISHVVPAVPDVNIGPVGALTTKYVRSHETTSLYYQPLRHAVGVLNPAAAWTIEQ